MEDCFEIWSGVNRTGCEVLADMRRCYKVRNFAPLMGLIEELQISGNRMEGALEDMKDLATLHEKIHKARQVLKKLREERKALDE